MSRGEGRGPLLRLLGSSVASQALLSAASLAVGLLLIRRTSGEQYGTYILVANAFLLLTSLQNAFFGPTLILRMTPLDNAGRGALVAGVHREQRQVLRWVFAPLAVAIALLGLLGAMRGTTALLLLAAILAAPAALTREFFRSASLAQQRAQDVVRCDLLYALLLVGGAAFATLSPLPAATAVATLACAALCAAMALHRHLRRSLPLDAAPVRGMLRRIAGLGAWSTAGAAVHWTFSQGYSYLVAATLDVGAVAAIAATRLLLMPVNLLSTGVGSMMLPLTAGWLQQQTPRRVAWRLLPMILGVAAMALLYLAAMWLLRDWIFAHVLKKEFAQRDQLLLLWSAVSLLMVVRDQSVHLLVSSGRLRQLTLITLGSALLSLAVSYWAMHRYGVAGALFGVLCGEAVNVAGIFAATALGVLRRPPAAEPLQPAPQTAS